MRVQLAELNAHRQSSGRHTIYQTFNTIAGQLYDLSFYYRVRRSNDEPCHVDVDVESDSFEAIFSQGMDEHVTGSCSLFTTQFEGLSNQMHLSFLSITPHSRTVVYSLDNVCVVS